MTFKHLTSDFSVSPQLMAADVAKAAGQGYRSLISNRPDGEEAGQPTADAMAVLASRHGMSFAHIPVVPGTVTKDDLADMKRALAALPGPVLGFCRSGMRAATMWALAQAADPERTLKITKAAGYDLDGLRAKLMEGHRQLACQPGIGTAS